MPNDLLILDGATGTELERRGVNTATPIWSAQAILDAPGILQQIHEDYLRAGADFITIATFRTHERSLAKAGLGDRAAELTRRAVEIARAARDRVNPKARVLGSVAPLEECFAPEKSPDAATCRREHEQMIDHLLDAGVDFILIETMITLREAEAAALEAQQRASGRWMISFCVQSEGPGPPGILLSGEPLIDLADVLGGAFAVGVNCVSTRAVEANVKLLRAMLPPGVRVMAYPNVGFDPPEFNEGQGDPTKPDVYAKYSTRWRDAGASIIGGCCGTTPEHIRALAAGLQSG